MTPDVLLKVSEIEEAIRQIRIFNETCIAWSAISAAERQTPVVIRSKYWLMASDNRVD